MSGSVANTVTPCCVCMVLVQSLFVNHHCMQPRCAGVLASFAFKMSRLSSAMFARSAPVSRGAFTSAHRAKCERCCARLKLPMPTCFEAGHSNMDTHEPPVR